MVIYPLRFVHIQIASVEFNRAVQVTHFQVCVTNFRCVYFRQCFSPVYLFICGSFLCCYYSTWPGSSVYEASQTYGTGAVGEMDRLKLYSFLKSDIGEAIFGRDQSNEEMRMIKSDQNVGG